MSNFAKLIQLVFGVLEGSLKGSTTVLEKLMVVYNAFATGGMAAAVNAFLVGVLGLNTGTAGVLLPVVLAAVTALIDYMNRLNQGSEAKTS